MHWRPAKERPGRTRIRVSPILILRRRSVAHRVLLLTRLNSARSAGTSRCAACGAASSCASCGGPALVLPQVSLAREARDAAQHSSANSPADAAKPTTRSRTSPSANECSRSWPKGVRRGRRRAPVITDHIAPRPTIASSWPSAARSVAIAGASRRFRSRGPPPTLKPEPFLFDAVGGCRTAGLRLEAGRAAQLTRTQPLIGA